MQEQSNSTPILLQQALPLVFGHNPFETSSTDSTNDNGGEALSSMSTTTPIPDAATMQERWAFRERIRRETMEHRRVLPHTYTGRNICSILLDRERWGSSRVVMVTNYHDEDDDEDDDERRVAVRGGPSSKQGDVSPSTVFESPISTTSTEQLDVAVVGSLHQQPLPMGQEQQHASCSSADHHGSATSGAAGALMSSSIVDKVEEMRSPYPLKLHRELSFYAESTSATRYQSAFLHHLGGNEELQLLDPHSTNQRPVSSPAVSTISVAFSPDAHVVASTHGDHTVKISCCHTGRLLQSLEGHPRTPWTVKFHPRRSNIVASGCLGHQVRVWDWKEAKLLQMVRLEYAIISLSFHPSGKLLAVANGTRLHFWTVHVPEDQDERQKAAGTSYNNSKFDSSFLADHNHGASGNNDIAGNNQSSGSRSADPPSHNPSTPTLLELDQGHMLRCVHFPPNGRTLILGGVNHTTEEIRRRNRGSGMSFYLRLWDFDIDRARGMMTGSRRVLSNPRTFVPRALLYNDGGFDVSPDGKSLCACAEYFLPQGVDNAMELLYQEEAPYGVDDEYEDDDSDHDEDPQHDGQAMSTEQEGDAFPFGSSPAAMKNQAEMVAAAIATIRGANRSPSFRDGMEVPISRTPPVAHREELAPMTPPVNNGQFSRSHNLSPPPPPSNNPQHRARKWRRRLVVSTGPERRIGEELSTPPPPPPPPGAPPAPGGIRPPHSLSVVSRKGSYGEEVKGRYVPHVVVVSLDTDSIPVEVDPKLPRGKPYGAVPVHYKPRLGQLLEACPLDANKASAVTCVKFSPATDYCLIGYGVREPLMEGDCSFHPVTALYRVRGGMKHVSTMLSGDDDVNIARFHPDSGYGFVYGTKQGRVRVLSPRPWNYYGP